MALENLTIEDIPWATDEYILVLAGDDFGQVVNESLKLAQGKDGTVDVASPWNLRSSTVDFQAQGVQPGHVVKLTSAPLTEAQKEYGTTEYGVVDAVAGRLLTLRRPGNVASAGDPFATATTLTQINFLVCTFGPILKAAAREIRGKLRWYANDEDIEERLFDDVLIEANFERTMERVFGTRAGRTVTTVGTTDVYGDKAKLHGAAYRQWMDEIIARLQGAGLGSDADGGTGAIVIA